MRDFAKIIRDEDGQQVLYYVDPGCEGEPHRLRCLAQRDGVTLTMTMSFADLTQAYRTFDNMTPSTASALTAINRQFDPEG